MESHRILIILCSYGRRTSDLYPADLCNNTIYKAIVVSEDVSARFARD